MKQVVLSFLILLSVTAININNDSIDQHLDRDIQDLKDSRFLAAKVKAEGGCVTVYSECNFNGNSASSCSGNIHEFDAPIKSVKVDPGMALSLIIGGVVIHVEQSLDCLSKPLNGEGAHVILKATTIAEIDQKYGK